MAASEPVSDDASAFTPLLFSLHKIHTVCDVRRFACLWAAKLHIPLFIFQFWFDVIFFELQ